MLSPPPELIIWTGLPVGNTSKRVRVLVPKGWIASGPQNIMRGTVCDDYMFRPRDRMPKLIRMILMMGRPSFHNAAITIEVRDGKYLQPMVESGTILTDHADGINKALREVFSPDKTVAASIWYSQQSTPTITPLPERVHVYPAGHLDRVSPFGLGLPKPPPILQRSSTAARGRPVVRPAADTCANPIILL